MDKVSNFVKSSYTAMVSGKIWLEMEVMSNDSPRYAGNR